MGATATHEYGLGGQTRIIINQYHFLTSFMLAICETLCIAVDSVKQSMAVSFPCECFLEEVSGYSISSFTRRMPDES